MKKPIDVDDYISSFPSEVQEILELMRATIKQAAPMAEEVISYAIPGYRLNGGLVSFAGYDKHIGFYPGAGGIAEFKTELSRYKSAKGSVQFPLGEPLPVKLIARIVKFRAKQNNEKARKK